MLLRKGVFAIVRKVGGEQLPDTELRNIQMTLRVTCDGQREQPAPNRRELLFERCVEPLKRLVLHRDRPMMRFVVEATDELFGAPRSGI